MTDARTARDEFRAHWREERGSTTATMLLLLLLLLFVIWTTVGRDVLRQRGVLPPVKAVESAVSPATPVTLLNWAGKGLKNESPARRYVVAGQ